MTHKPGEHDHEQDWLDADHSDVTDDPWHAHSGEAPPQHAHGETSPGGIALFGVISFAILVLTVAGVGVYFRQVNRAAHVRLVERDPAIARDAQERKATWRGQLESGFDWIDPANGVVGIPIDQAMDAVVQELKAQK